MSTTSIAQPAPPSSIPVARWYVGPSARYTRSTSLSIGAFLSWVGVHDFRPSTKIRMRRSTFDDRSFVLIDVPKIVGSH